MEHTDEDLVALYLLGKEEVFKDIVERYTSILYNFTVRFVGGSNTQDILQDVFIKVWKNLKRFDKSKSSFKTWIFTITRNTITDYLRKKKSINFSDLGNLEDSFIADIPDNVILPDKIIEKLEDAESLNRFLKKLPMSYQAVLVLYYQEEMTFAEIGESLGKPLNTVKSYHYRAIELLRKMIV